MSQPSISTVATEADDQYDQFEAALRLRIATRTGPIFETDATPEALWAAYLNGIPEARRQHYSCHACRRFIQRYGGLVTLNDVGVPTPALWNIISPPFFGTATADLCRLVAHAKVVGVFLASESTWGMPQAGGWSHLSAPSPNIYTGRLLTATQAMAEKLEDYKILSHGLADYNQDVVNQAVRVLSADALDRSEKTLGIATWLAKLHESIKTYHRRDNLIWRAVATAPPGFCHVRSTMISTLLDDIVAGLAYDAIAARWAEKMHPLRYQRPTASPSEGTIEQAEKLVEKLGVAKSLLRRFATLDDVLAKVWVPAPRPEPAKDDRVFGHLRRSPYSPEIELPAQTMTWDKFSRTVLFGVVLMEIAVPSHGAFYGLVTAVDPAAPAIIQWDGLEGHPRNPVSWYFYANGSSAAQWNLFAPCNSSTPSWAKVTSTFLSPHQWQDAGKFSHQPKAVFFSIEGCRDNGSAGNRGLGLFPEILRSDFHGIRSVIEAHSRSGGIEGVEAGDANGLAFQGTPVTLRVRTAEGTATYVIDRMD